MVTLIEQNHYQVLGVSWRASASEIRSAYVRLLKKYHPDSAEEQSAKDDRAQVQRLVTAYNTLKDPQKRAAYDSQLREQQHSGDVSTRHYPSRGLKTQKKPANAIRPQVARPVVLKKKKKKRAPRPNSQFAHLWPKVAPGLGYVAMAAAAIIGLQLLISRFGQINWSFVPGTSATVPVRQLPDVPSPARLQPVARLAAVLSSTDANQYSSKCFSQARRSTDPTAADICIAFDTAYVYWRESGGAAFVADPYFHEAAIKSRVAESYPRIGPVAAVTRAQSMRAVTFQALLRIATDPDAHAQGGRTVEDEGV